MYLGRDGRAEDPALPQTGQKRKKKNGSAATNWILHKTERPGVGATT